MSVTLVGGAFDPATAPGLLVSFLTQACARTAGRPVVAVLLLDQGRLEEFLPSYAEGLGPDVDVLPVPLSPDRPLAALPDADGILVGGGWTPGYHAALLPVARTVRGRVVGGTPYAGFSAGAMVAGDTALLGGYLSGGREVCEDGCSEGLGELTVRPGVGLVPFTCDVHVTAAGTLGRALELVAAGLVDTAVGLDEDTCLTVAPGERPEDGRVCGAGSAWLIRAGVGGEAVVRRVAAD